MNHSYLYNFATLFIGQGKGAPPNVCTAFNDFTEEMGNSFDRERQFPNMQYNSIITSVICSFETLIGNHVGLNVKSRTLRYLFTRISSADDPSYLPFSTGAERDLAERIYIVIASNQEMTYPETPVVDDAERTSIIELIEECHQRLRVYLWSESTAMQILMFIYLGYIMFMDEWGKAFLYKNLLLRQKQVRDLFIVKLNH